MKRSYGRSLPLATCGDPMMTVRAEASFRHAVKSAAGRRTGGPIRAGQRVSGGPRRQRRTPRPPAGSRPGHPHLTGYRTGRRAGRPTGRQPIRPAMPRSGRPRGWSAETMDGRGKRSRKTNASAPPDDTRSGPPARLITPTAPGGGAERGAAAAGSLPGSTASGAVRGIPGLGGRRRQPARSAALRSTRNVRGGVRKGLASRTAASRTCRRRGGLPGCAVTCLVSRRVRPIRVRHHGPGGRRNLRPGADGDGGCRGGVGRVERAAPGRSRRAWPRFVRYTHSSCPTPSSTVAEFRNSTDDATAGRPERGGYAWAVSPNR
ncbi:hypothetical protein SAMN05428954_6583 [Streptomyces sp. 2112.3]|nr:hypothetical protein SAMN05428954_6583 [Streptomyces sp. 2112.3]